MEDMKGMKDFNVKGSVTSGAAGRRLSKKPLHLFMFSMTFMWSWLLASAQTAPQPEIYLASVNVTGGRVTVGTPVNVSQNADYDNQPTFLADGSAILFLPSAMVRRTTSTAIRSRRRICSR